MKECNNIIDKNIVNIIERTDEKIRNTIPNSPWRGDGVQGRKELGQLLELGNDSKIFKSILNHPKLLPYFHEFLGEGYRMDHLPFLIAQEKGSEGFKLHGII